jgi:hypothetical protein
MGRSRSTFITQKYVVFLYAVSATMVRSSQFDEACFCSSLARSLSSGLRHSRIVRVVSHVCFPGRSACCSERINKLLNNGLSDGAHSRCEYGLEATALRDDPHINSRDPSRVFLLT